MTIDFILKRTYTKRSLNVNILVSLKADADGTENVCSFSLILLWTLFSS